MRLPVLAAAAVLSSASGAAAASRPSDAFLAACAARAPACAAFWSAPVPPAFGVRFHLSGGAGAATAWVRRAAAPPMADRFFLLASLDFFAGSPLYRVLRGARSFVAQWGYRGVPAVDGAWLARQTSNATAAVAPPGNVRGALAMGTSEVAGPQPPNCSAAQCSRGFAVELFVNLANNGARLDAADFSPFAQFDEESMRVLDAAYAGYGECADLCAEEGGSSPYCLPAPGGGWLGVNLTRMLERGTDAYLRPNFPLLTYIERMELLPAAGEGP